MSRAFMKRPTVELSIAATSEELAILSAAAQRRRMSLKDFLRIQLMSVAKSVARLEPATAAKNPADAQLEYNPATLKPAFLP